MPMLPDYAFLVTDPSANRLVVTAAAADLVFIESLVGRLDVPRDEETLEQRVFPIQHAGAAELATMIRTILDATLRAEQGDATGAVSVIGGSTPPPSGGSPGNESGGNPDGPNMPGGPGSRGSRGGGRNRDANAAAPAAVQFPVSGLSYLVQADTSRNWIIVAAPPAIMQQVERWIKEFDQPKKASEYYELFDIKHADINELATQITQAIEGMPARRPDDVVRIIPFPKSGQLLVYGSESGRIVVNSLLKQLDVESSEHQIIREIHLEFESAESVKTKIEELFGQESQPQSSIRFGGYGRRSNVPQEQKITVTADTQRNSVTIMTDPARMKRIESLITDQWDQPINYDAVKPKVLCAEIRRPCACQDDVGKHVHQVKHSHFIQLVQRHHQQRIEYAGGSIVRSVQFRSIARF